MPTQQPTPQTSLKTFLSDERKPRGGKRGKTQSAKKGGKFEKAISETCDLYKAKKLAYIQQFFPPTVWVPAREGKPGYLIHARKTGFDFVGATISDHEPVFIECKTTDTGSIQIGQETSGIKLHQLEILLWLEEMGFKVMLLWQIRKANDVVIKIIPSQIVKICDEEKRKYITFADCEDRRIPKVLKDLTGGYDFLGLL